MTPVRHQAVIASVIHAARASQIPPFLMARIAGRPCCRQHDSFMFIKFLFGYAYAGHATQGRPENGSQKNAMRRKDDECREMLSDGQVSAIRFFPGFLERFGKDE